MNFLKVLEKGVFGLLTFVAAYLASNPGVITKLLPSDIINMSIGGAIAGALVALANFLKHLNK